MFGFETIFESLPQFLLVCLILAVAETIYVLLGFGAGLVAVGSLALVLPELRDAVVLLLLVNLPAEVFVVRASWKAINWRGVLVLFAGVGAGIPIGSWLLRSGEPAFLLTLLGLFLILVGAFFIIRPRLGLAPPPGWVAPPVGLFSGLLTGLFGTGGPPLIAYYQLSGVEKAVFRGNLMAIFLLMTAVRVPSYAVLGLIDGPRLWSALLVLPAVLVGAVAGNRIHLSLDESTFRRLVSAAMIALGLLLLVP